MGARIPIHEPGLVCQDQQDLRLDKISDQRRQGIVVPEADLVRNHGVVLIDHGDHAEAQHLAQGAAGIEIAPPIREIVMRQQHLGGMQALSHQSLRPRMHEPALPDGGGCL